VIKLDPECINAVVAWWADKWQQLETREAFRAALRNQLEAFEHEDVSPEYGGYLLSLDCDYDPKGLLLDAVRDTGIDCRGYLFSATGLLPSKHLVMVYPGGAEAKAGYGADFVTLWGKP
jgi:hypothetical protein